MLTSSSLRACEPIVSCRRSSAEALRLRWLGCKRDMIKCRNQLCVCRGCDRDGMQENSTTG